MGDSQNETQQSVSICVCPEFP